MRAQRRSVVASKRRGLPQFVARREGGAASQHRQPMGFGVRRAEGRAAVSPESLRAAWSPAVAGRLGVSPDSRAYIKPFYPYHPPMANVIEQHRNEVVALCRRASVRRLDAFGSATRVDFDPARSDIDFLVEFEDLPPAQYAEAYFALKESLESLFGRSVDLVTPSGLENPYFRERVFSERRLIYAR